MIFQLGYDLQYITLQCITLIEYVFPDFTVLVKIKSSTAKPVFRHCIGAFRGL